MGKTINREKIQQCCWHSSPSALLIIVIHLTLAKYPFASLSLLFFLFWGREREGGEWGLVRIFFNFCFPFQAAKSQFIILNSRKILESLGLSFWEAESYNRLWFCEDKKATVLLLWKQVLSPENSSWMYMGPSLWPQNVQWLHFTTTTKKKKTPKNPTIKEDNFLLDSDYSYPVTNLSTGIWVDLVWCVGSGLGEWLLQPHFT